MSRILTVLALTLLTSAAAVADGPVEACPDGQPPVEWYLDADEDGYGDASYSVVACEAPLGFVDNAADLHDGNPDIVDR
jgi:hypothetical protein